jgi:hypothetical protein
MMRNVQSDRRLFLAALAALPAGVAAAQQKPQPAAAGVRVAAGDGRFNQILRLPGGGPLFIKVSAQDTAGAFLLTEQPSAGKGGPPKHFHRDEDEWFYCLEGRRAEKEYGVVNVGPPLTF